MIVLILYISFVLNIKNKNLLIFILNMNKSYLTFFYLRDNFQNIFHLIESKIFFIDIKF